MNPDLISQLATNWGPMGMLVGYLIWRDVQMRGERRETEKDRLLYDRDVMEYNKARLDADKALAASLASLTTAILKGNDRA